MEKQKKDLANNQEPEKDLVKMFGSEEEAKKYTRLLIRVMQKRMHKPMKMGKFKD